MKKSLLALVVFVLVFAACSPSQTNPASTTAGLFVDIVSVSQSARSNTAVIEVKASPGAVCSLAVLPPVGSLNTNFSDDTADKNGKVSWTWDMGASPANGAYTFSVKAVLDGETKYATADFQLK